MLIISFSKSENTQNILPSLLFMIEIPNFALLFQNFEPYFFDGGLLEACGSYM